MNGIAALVDHVDEVVALYDDLFAWPLNVRALGWKGRADESGSGTWEERFDGVESVFVTWPGKPQSTRPALTFHGTRPKQWTSARAELETLWGNRDAIHNAIDTAKREGASGRVIAGRVADIYGGWLERRAKLVDRDTLRELCAAALRDAMAAGTNAENAVTALRQELRVFRVRDAIDWRELRRKYLRPALENARVYADAIGQRESAGQPATSVSPPGSTQAEAADDDYAGIARRLSRKARRTLEYMHEMNAHSRADKLTRQFIADEIRLELDDMRVVSTELGKTGRQLIESVDGRHGGWWLSPDGVRVAERVAATRHGSIGKAATQRA